MERSLKQSSGKSFLRRSYGWYWFISLLGIVGLAWVFIGPWHYERALSEKTIDIHIFCDTSDLNVPELKAFVFYDKVALSPAAKALGLYQNRPPERVRVFFPMSVEHFDVTPVSIRLKSVRYGPITRVFFVAGKKSFHADIKDRRLVDNVIYVRPSS